MRLAYSLQSVWKLKRASLSRLPYRDYLQAGKSVAGVDSIEPAGDVVRRFAAAAAQYRHQAM
jgi:nitronate monooxygenase